MGGHIFRHLALRGDGIAEEAVASGADGRLGNGFIAFPKFFFHRQYPPSQNFSTVMMESGQIFAQLAQAMHAVMSVTWAG